ncbi:hypothetical protein SAMD00019534_007580, partial [Acytostelium subglobosum LB1]|uniref:hypothetical protein n=1 Tax=Acytostelium subglobosum LB1 TaxID=1410327 RepID=UPI00064495ED
YYLSFIVIISMSNKTKIYRYAMAPMVDVTDYAFRQIVSLKSNSSFMTWTEFVSVDGLIANPNKFKRQMAYHSIQRPIVCQLFGHDAKKFKEAARIVRDQGFDAIDINMGCPVRKVVERQSAGSALILDPMAAGDIIKATKDGVDNALPVFVKTRIGFDHIDIDRWIPILLQTEPQLLTLHLRTKKELSNCPAHWEDDVVGRTLRQRGDSTTTRIFGNGDLESMEQCRDKLNTYNQLDGIMVGRGTYGNPWFFSDVNGNQSSLKDKLTAMVEHAILIEQQNALYSGQSIKSIGVHIRNYCQPLSQYGDVAALRTHLIQATTSKDIANILNQYLISKRLPDHLLDDHQTIKDSLYEQVDKLDISF